MAFTVHARLGRGRTVETFAATLEVGSERLGVVVKRPRPELDGNEAFTSALEAWGRSQAELDHESLVAVLEAGHTRDGVYVIQEHVEGVPLQAVVRTMRKRRRTLAPAHAVTIARRVSEALAYLAEPPRRGHGDLDPDEILLSYEGQVRLTDPRLYELEVHVGADLMDDAESRRPYRAPEVQVGETAGPAADVYSLALILMEMLIGHPVWTAETMTVKDAIAALTDFTHIGQASPKLTKDLLDLLGPCLSEDPVARPTPAAVQEKLQAIQAGHQLADDDRGLGEFVQAILPPKQQEEAPTQLISAEQAEALARQSEAKADWESASVLINPEIEARARAAMGAVPALRVPTPGPAPVEALVAASVSLDEASVTRLEQIAKDVEREAALPPERAPSAAPVGEVNATPGWAQRGEAWLEDLQSRLPFATSRRQLMIGAAAVFALLLIVLGVAATGPGGHAVQLRATSDPPHADLYVDDLHVGTTPFDQVVEAQGQLLRLRFELDGFRPHEVSIGTAAAELRYEASLEPTEPD